MRIATFAFRLIVALWGVCTVVLGADTDSQRVDADTDTVYPYFEVDVQPKLPRKREPTNTFPEILPSYKSPVVAILEVVVTKEGKITQATLVQTNEKDFGQEARYRVKTWHITPAEKDGKAVSCQTILILKASRDDGPRSIQFNVAAYFAQRKNQPTADADGRDSDAE